MIKRIHLRNYRSFVDAHVDLAPFTLVVGANAAGKTNFLRAFVDCGPYLVAFLQGLNPPSHREQLPRHFNAPREPGVVEFTSPASVLQCSTFANVQPNPQPGRVELFRLQPDRISEDETVTHSPFVKADGAGTTQSLESLKNGDQESVFRAAERALMTYVPEIEKLSFVTVQDGRKQIQVRERGIRDPVRANQLSDGTRFIIGLLAIIHQAVKPPVICLEDLDHGMHPRVFEEVVKLMQRIAREQGVQIIGTTHNPYLVDCFQEEPEAVVIVDKKEGASTLATLAQKLQALDYGKVSPADMPLGNLWFSGFVGGVPHFIQPKPR